MQTLTQFEVYEPGPLTVIGFGTRDTLDQFDLAACRNEVFDLIRDHHCQMLAIDLTGIQIIPSGLLGLLVSVHQQEISVCLFNPSEDLREVLQITKLDRLFPCYRVAA
jgi:anti-sigma B factor antagonist